MIRFDEIAFDLLCAPGGFTNSRRAARLHRGVVGVLIPAMPFDCRRPYEAEFLAHSFWARGHAPRGRCRPVHRRRRFDAVAPALLGDSIPTC